MRVAAILAALTCAAIVSAQGPPEGIAPDAKAPEGCDGSPKNNFTIGYTLLSKMKRETAVDAKNAALECNLKDGILRDPQNRIGSVVANRQFQFDGPPQAGAIYTGGFSVCKNNSLAIGATTRWWKCGSGDFYNLYDEWIGAQCDEIRIVVTYKGDTSSEGSSSSSVSASATSTQSSSATSSASSSASSSSGSSSSGSATSTPTSSSRSSSSASSSGAPQTTQTRAPTENNASNPPAPSAGDAAPTRVPRRETFGAVVGIVGAALLL